MSGKGLGRRPGYVPWPNPNELQATNRNSMQGPGTSGTRRMVSSARHQDTSLGAAALSHPEPGRHHHVSIEETRPGAVAVPGPGAGAVPGSDSVTVASHEASTVNVIAQAVDTEEENRLRHEHDLMRHELDQLHQILDNAPIVLPDVTTNGDVENGDENVHANHDDLQINDDPKCGSKGRRWVAMSAAILLIVVAIAATLALVRPSEPTSPGPTTLAPNTQEPTTIAPSTQPPPSQDLIDLISSASPGGGVALADPLTPQNRALTWLAGDPNLLNYTAQLKIQHYALATLYYTTKGDSWRTDDYSPSYEDVCGTWYNNDGDSEMVVNCTSDGSVFWINLGDNNLQGVIPPEIVMLSDSLEGLLLNNNALVGNIPTEIGALTKLTLLSLANNTLTGAIPSVIGLLTDLEELWLHDNKLNGTLPTEMGDLTKLTILSLAGNRLTGTIFPTEMGLLTKLAGLVLDNNLLTGTIPPSIGTFTNLEFLGFGSNILRGKIPTELGLLTKLINLYLAKNGFNGTIPSELGLLTKLTYLSLDRNELTGTVPSTLASLTLLNQLFLFDNDLTGSLLGFLCGNDFYYFAANTCGQDEIECECCTHCCDLEGYCVEV